VALRSGYVKRLVVLAAACALVTFSAGGASAAKTVLWGSQAVSSGGSPSAVASAGWGPGVEAVLPANAAPTKQGAGVSSVSCPSAGNCSAAGAYKDSSGVEQVLLLTETNGNWSTGVEAVLPVNVSATTPAVSLGSISCASAGNCSAVGTYCASATCTGNRYGQTSGSIEGLLLNEADGGWAVGVEAALPANAAATDQHVMLDSVSCASAGNCGAVGSYVDSSGAVKGLVLTESAGSWATGVEAALPANAAAYGASFLGSVSCASAGNCSAVGSYVDSSFYSDGLLLTETDGSWATGVEAPMPANALTLGEVSLSSVSCASAGNCGAVGSYVDSSHETQGLLLNETAGTWATGVEAPLPANARSTYPGPGGILTSVSCPSAGNCGAVGYYFDGSVGTFDGLMLNETAGPWAIGVEAALPANAQAQNGANLDDVSCSSAGNCAALGTYWDNSLGGLDGLMLTETAGSWATGVDAALPANAAGGGLLKAVSCVSVGDCTVVGSYTDSSGGGEGLLIGGSPASVKLDISKNGTGSGTVSSTPTGIDCGSTCSATFDAGTSLSLRATPTRGSRFGGWSGAGCFGTRSCQPNTGISEQTVTPTFTLLSKCVVPKLEGKTLRAAKIAIRTHNCTLGKITHATSRTIKKGHVISQRPKPGRRLKHGARVNLLVSKGRP
jgi:PASTA domain